MAFSRAGDEVWKCGRPEGHKLATGGAWCRTREGPQTAALAITLAAAGKGEICGFQQSQNERQKKTGSGGRSWREWSLRTCAERADAIIVVALKMMSEVYIRIGSVCSGGEMTMTVRMKSRVVINFDRHRNDVF